MREKAVGIDVQPVRLPAERFYWALLDASTLAGRPTSESLGYLLEAEIPVALEEVNAAFVRVPGTRRVLACAIEKEELRGALDAGALSMTPQSLPPFVDSSDGAAGDPATLELLTGPFTPKEVLRAKRRGVLESAAAIVAVALLLVAGFERERAAVFRDREDALAQAEKVYVERLGYAAAPGRLPLALQAEAELRRLRQTRRGPAAASPAVDASATLASLLSLWPRDAAVRTESIQTTADAIHVRGEVASREEAQDLATALGAIPGLRASIPTVRAGTGAVSFSLEWSREGGAR